MLLGPSLTDPSNSYTCHASLPAHQRFQELARVAGASRAFTLSVKLHLYTTLRQQREEHGKAGLSAGSIAQLLGLDASPGARGVVDWLDLLTALDVLQRTGSRRDGALYSNSPAADAYLARQSPDYMGGHAILYHDRTFPQLQFLEHSLRTGVQPPLARQLVTPVLDTFAGTAAGSSSSRDGASQVSGGGDPVAFAMGMSGCNKPAFEQLAAKFDWSRYTTLADIGGSAGVLCCAVAAAQPHMRCTTLDLAAVHQAAVAYVAQQGLSDRVQVADVDFFGSSPFPSADVITMSMILHDWGRPNKQLLMQKAFATLPPGGAFVALDLVIDDARRANVWGLLMSLDMLLEFEGERAADYTFEEFTAWATSTGFARTELLRLAGPNSAAVAYK